MHSTPFSPFHVYELNQKHPAARLLPFNFFLCLTMPEFLEPTTNYNVVGFPILVNQGRIQDKRLRLPLRTLPDGELQIIGGPTVAIDLIQPLNHTMLNPNSYGHLMGSEVMEVKEMALAFLALKGGRE